MPTNTIEKVLKALSPLSCKEVRQRFDALLREQLHGEEEEWVREHLLVCDKCLDAFTNKVGEKVDAGEIPLREWPNDLPLPDMELYTSSSSLPAATQEALGIMWEEARATTKEWAKEKLKEVQRCIAGTIRLLQMEPALAGEGLGQKVIALPTMGGKGPAIEVEASAGQLQVPFEIVEGPIFTKDGRFLLTLETTDPQWERKRVVCTVALVEEQKVSFAGVVQPTGSGQKWRVAIAADGLPQEEEDTPVPLDFVQLSLM